jgi:hypothetical protein
LQDDKRNIKKRPVNDTLKNFIKDCKINDFNPKIAANYYLSKN